MVIIPASSTKMVTASQNMPDSLDTNSWRNAWTAPRTWIVAELVTAAYMNAHVRDNLNYPK
jgi:hypothetical protein